MKRAMYSFCFILAIVFVLSGCGRSRNPGPSADRNRASESAKNSLSEPTRDRRQPSLSSQKCEHDYQPATCPATKVCTKCGETTGGELNHVWSQATCTEPATCTQCGTTLGRPVDHTWVAKGGPKVCSVCQAEESVPQPKKGQIFIGRPQSGPVNLTVSSSSSKSYYVKLKNVLDEDIFSFFVPAGETVEISVPQKPCYVYFACGETWYGTDLLFGENTSYSKDSGLIDFGMYAVTYTLIPSVGGNFSETTISADDF